LANNAREGIPFTQVGVTVPILHRMWTMGGIPLTQKLHFELE